MTQKAESIRKVRPRADVLESDNEYRIALDLVGVDREKIGLTLEQETLKVTAQRGTTPGESVEFEREFGVPSAIDRDKVTADYALGVLTVTLPKQANSKPRRIAVSAG
jgi:HSP20 family protein